MSNSKYALAMYDVRGKQEYIFKTNKLKEIVGGSCIIRDCFKEYLFPSAEEYMRRKAKKEGIPLSDDAVCGIYNYNDSENEPEYISEINKGKEFSQKAFERMMQDEKCAARYAGEVVYEGGGNFFVLYKDKETCIEINKIFTRKLLKELYTLKVLCTYIELENGLVNFIEVTSLPLTKYNENTRKKVSTEAEAKLAKHLDVYNEKYGEKDLDKLVTRKGEESLLAVVYIDGNNMGAKVQNVLGRETSYDQCVKKLRETSEFIQKNYVEDRIKDIDQMLEEKAKKGKKKAGKRLVVFAGDEINLICNARDAYDIAKTYLKGLHQVSWKDSTEPCSACAGIAIFHSHAPYAQAYKIAEECCESGKTRMKKLEKAREKEGKSKEVCYIDVHYCQKGIGMSLDDIREKEVGGLISKPWLLDMEDEKNTTSKMPEDITIMEIEKVVEALQMIESRTNVKDLAVAAKLSEGAFNLEMRRIYAHQSDEDIKRRMKEIFVQEDREEFGQKYKKYRKMIYDIVIVYDLWFRKEEGEEKYGNNSK